ncbi:vWA domain-containing protein [Actinokineospora diospyrosa]|uniref:Conserved protein YegL, contains vWA domain of TerY type n=1 Tax=Actinokineospora diospyrosa TaxID=103728 RepID=A0ABT1I5T4_9PSEU|nr:hypothetical protein [Actinokineospora diospyrosa]MCP2267990.1 putative conserved protein YegL, contains vWA domain of TerY type [Actinokineospora diospyrosa]
MRTEVLPCYVVCDLSSSMADHVGELNLGLREFRAAVCADAPAAARTRVGVVGFAGIPRLLHPLRPITELPELTVPRPRVGTNFGLTFTFLRETIERDVRALKADQSLVRRPVVFFASDGRPTDPTTWPKAYDALADPRWPTRPRVVAYGIGVADRRTLGRIGVSGVFLGQDGIPVATALGVSVTRQATPEHV